MDDVTTEHDNDFDALEDNTDIINNDNDNLGFDPTALDSRIRDNPEHEVAHYVDCNGKHRKSYTAV